MVFRKLLLCCVGVLVAGQAAAQVELKTYADRDGYIDVQALTCAQLANTYQEDADYLTTWYSGWYNGLAKKHAMKVDRAKTLEHELIVYCKANQGKKVIQAIDVVFKAYRAEKGIKMKE
jgi:HdeA/HdeB family